MDKFAQVGMFEKNKHKRSPINEVVEEFGRVINPRLSKLLESLKEIDDAVREKAKGLNPLLKAAKTNLNRREYMAAIAYLDMFHDLAESIDEEFSKLNSGVDEEHYKFLIEDLEPEHLNQLLKIDPKIVKHLNKNVKTDKAASNRVILNKEAGTADWWHNISTDRGKDLSIWEKAYPKYTKNLKKATTDMLSKSTSYLSFLLSCLKRMDGLRASRKLEDYLKEMEKLKTKYNVFNHTYIDFYKKHAKKYVDMVQAKQTKKEQENQKELEELKTRMNGVTPGNDVVPAQPLQNPRLPFPTQNQLKKEVPEQLNLPFEDKKVSPPSEGPPSSPHHARENKEEKSKTEKAISDVAKAVKKVKESVHTNNFLLKLSFLKNDPVLIVKEILRYAQECDDEKTRERLMTIARQLVK